MHLVDDDVLDSTKNLAGLAGQEQVQALRRRDQDLGRILGEGSPGIRRRVAGPGCNSDLRQLDLRTLRGSPDPRQRGAEVALDIVGEGLQWADVEDPDAAWGVGS